MGPKFSSSFGHGSCSWTATFTFLFLILVPSLALPVNKATTGSQLLASFLGVQNPITTDLETTDETTAAPTDDCMTSETVATCTATWTSGPVNQPAGSTEYCNGFDAYMACIDACFNSDTQFNGYVRSQYWYQTAKTNCATT